MKRNILFLLIMVMSVVAYGQKKPKINSALSAAEDGDLAEAKEIIDAAIVHEKTRDDAKTWYYRGLIYAALDTTSNPNYQNLEANALKTSMDAFKKATEMNEGKGELFTSGPNGLVLKSQQISQIWGYYLNKGVIAFQANNSEDAVKYFTKSQIVMPEDTTGYLYAGLAAQNGKQFDVAAKNFNALITELDHHDPDVYNSLIWIETNVNKNDDRALELLKEAKKRWPENRDLAKSEISLLIKLDRTDEAIAELEAATEVEPENPELHFSLGVMHEELGQLDKAEAAYLKAVEVDPSNLSANFNLGVLHFNEAVAIYKERNSLGISSADMKKSKELQKKAEESLNKSLPYWVKVREIEPSNRTALEQLRYIYIQLKQNDKAEEIQDAMNEYGYSDEG